MTNSDITGFIVLFVFGGAFVLMIDIVGRL